MFDISQDPRLQRARGTVRLGMASRAGRTVLTDLGQAGCLKVMLPRNHDPVPDAVLINTAGGLTGGDVLNVKVQVDDGAALRLATQTAERIYRSTGETASVSLDFVVGEAARFDWLAQETILFEAGRVARALAVDMAIDASVLLVEPVILGRRAMGETVTTGSLTDQWRITRAGRLAFADALKLNDFEALAAPAALGPNTAFATLLLVDPCADTYLTATRAIINDSGITGGASAWNDLLLVRLLAQSPRQMRITLIRLIEKLRGGPAPRVWTM